MGGQTLQPGRAGGTSRLGEGKDQMDSCERAGGSRAPELPEPEHRNRPGHCRQLDTTPGIESRPTDRSGHRRESLAGTASLKCHSRAFAGRASVPTPRGTARASRPAQHGRGFLEPFLPPGNPTRPGQGHTEPAIPEQTLLFTPCSLSKVLLPQPGLTPGSSQQQGDPRPSPTGGWELLGTRGCPPVLPSQNLFTAFSRAPPPAIFPAAVKRHLDSCFLHPPFSSRWIMEGLGSQTPPRSSGRILLWLGIP